MQCVSCRSLNGRGPRVTPAGSGRYLLEGLEHLLPLTEVPKEELQGPRHQGRVVVHGQVEQHAQEGPATVIVQVQGGVLLTAGAHRTGEAR